MRTLIRCDQPAGPGIGLVISEAVVVLVVLGLRVGVRLRLLLGQQLVERLARPLLRQRRAEPLPGRPPVRRDDPRVQRVITGVAVQRVRRVQRSIIFKVVGGVVDLVIGHSSPSPPRRSYSAGSWGQASEDGGSAALGQSQAQDWPAAGRADPGFPGGNQNWCESLYSSHRLSMRGSSLLTKSKNMADSASRSPAGELAPSASAPSRMMAAQRSTT